MIEVARRRRALLLAVLGGLVTFAFGSLWLALAVREKLEAAAARDLREKGTSVFATLDSGRQISRWGRTYYFYSYSGYLDNRLFRKEEQVTADMYFLLTEGKTVVVRAYRDPSGQLVARIEKSAVPYESPLGLLRLLCAVLAGAGGLAMLSALPAIVQRGR